MNKMPRSRVTLALVALLILVGSSAAQPLSWRPARRNGVC